MKRTIVALAALLVAGPVWAQKAVSNPEGRLIVEFDDSLSSVQRQALLARSGYTVVEDLDPLPAAIVKVAPSKMGPLGVIGLKKLDRRILNVEEDFFAKWIEETPVMPSFPTMRAVMENLPKAPAPEPQSIPWGIERVRAPKAWASTLGRKVKVAVIDTGVGPHPDVKVAGGYSARTFALSDSYEDGNGHGTHVAGTIAGLMNDIGVVGVAPEAEIYAVRVLDKNGSGWATDIVKGISWCAKNRMDVANMSLGAPRGLFLMHWAIKLAKLRGVTVVAAAGNNGESVEWPAAYEEVIAVAASDSKDKIASFSSRGKDVEFIAPGVDVKSTLPGGAYGTYSGTSMASPHVAGLAALAVERGAHGVEEVRLKLNAAAAPIPGLSREEQGAGMIDAGKIVR